MATTTTDGVTATTSTDAYGNSYTSSISAEGLQSEDFIKLMLTELSLQDPTNTVDSSQMLESQLQLSTLEANQATVKAMENLTDTFKQTALSSAASIIGNIVEDGSKDSAGEAKQYKVSSVANNDGTITLTAYEITGYYDVYGFEKVDSADTSLDSTGDDDSLTFTDSAGKEHSVSTKGKTYEELATELNAIDGITATMSQTSDGYQMLVYVSGGSSSISSEGIDLTYSKTNSTTYGNEAETLNYSDITKIYS